ncbi:MAG: methyl-accepting chemotaxis protein [Synergistaceae bacterium]|jgi:methyl-accepting chemotaxis protein|nr:methyl-accepting chemotaxis protein [Synergistaceae bacterium]
MSFFKNRSIGAKLGILTGIPLAIIILMNYYNRIDTNRTNARFIYAYDNYSVHATNVALLRANYEANLKNILKVAITSDPKTIRNVREDIDKRQGVNDKIIGFYSGSDMDDREKELWRQFEAEDKEITEAREECLNLGEANRDTEATAEFFDNLEPATNEVIKTLTLLQDHLVEMSDKTQGEAVEESVKSNNMLSIVAFAAIIFTGAVGLFVSRLITIPINATKAKIIQFATGDLTVEFKDSGRDAISQMCNELDKMMVTLRGAVSAVQNASDHIANSSQDFAAMSQETNASLDDFRSNIDETSSNLTGLASSSEEVNASVEEVAAGAQTTAEKGTDIARRVDDAMKAGDDGMNAVHSVVEGIGSVADSSAESSSAVLELGTRARQIQSFVSQIGSIADQTNLLALNAAIEAARAGDAGRGFAVVAEEVRKLAEESNVAAKRIEELASTITADLDKIVDYSQKNTDASKKAKELSSATESAISNMLGYLSDIASATQDLAAVAQEQAASSEEIAEAVQDMSTKINNTANSGENIRSGVTEVSAASKRVASGAERLAELSGDLEKEMSYFKLGGGIGEKTARLRVQ